MPDRLEKEIVGHAIAKVYRSTLSIECVINGINYTLYPHSSQNNRLCFNVVRRTEYDQELKDSLIETIKALNKAEPFMVMDFKDGKFYGSKDGKEFIAFKLFNKIIFMFKDKYKEAIEKQLFKEIQRINKYLYKLQKSIPRT